MASILNSFLTASLLPIVLSGVVSNGQKSSESQNAEAFAERTFFYVGGQYVNTTIVSCLSEPIFPGSAADRISQLGSTQEDQYMVGQIYVERLTPPNVLHEHPLVFIHGSGQTATVRARQFWPLPA